MNEAAMTPPRLLHSPNLVAVGLSVGVIRCRYETWSVLPAGIVLCMRLANERRRYNVTSSLIGWAHAENYPCIVAGWLADPDIGLGISLPVMHYRPTLLWPLVSAFLRDSPLGQTQWQIKWKGRLICAEGHVSLLNKCNPNEMKCGKGCARRLWKSLDRTWMTQATTCQ